MIVSGLNYPAYHQLLSKQNRIAVEHFLRLGAQAFSSLGYHLWVQMEFVCLSVNPQTQREHQYQDHQGTLFDILLRRMHLRF